MVFNGAFHIPSWLLNGVFGPESLIAHCRREEGVSADPNAGSLALARWLMDDPERAAREAQRAGSPLSMGGVINRLVAGAVLPSEPLARSIEQMTDGAVGWALWGRAVPSLDFARDERDVLTGEPPLDCARDESDKAEAVDAAWSVLGETPSGPLFRVTKAGGVVEVEGFGLTLRTSVAAASMLRDRLAAALA